MASIIECLTVTALAGIGLKIIVSEERVRMLRSALFRGSEVAYAGNCSRWSDPLDMVRDADFGERFGDIFADAFSERWPLIHQGFTERVTIPFDAPVGWVTSLPREHVNGARLAPRWVNDRFKAMVVDPGDAEHPAPLTNLLTVDYTAKTDFKERGKIAIRINDLAIGEDLSDLEGDLTQQIQRAGELSPRKFVFFLPQHAGGSEFIPLDP